MARFVLTRRSPLTAEACWDRLTDWPRHGDRVPFTTVRADHGSGRQVGDTILARTRVGPLAFDDPMEIVDLVAPGPGRDGSCRLEKRGRVVRGWAELTVRRLHPEGGTEVTWTEQISIACFPRAVDPVVACSGRAVFGRVLSHLLS
ncbi:Immediate-early protein 2 [Streptomyces tateyamensis]|uniref:Immediate-early protein 2 n=1 Tax=Streptomyces tateyamensis TaxID=565073 RepID=A0A2V4P357_9ACTN|nr:SRPBCC family protein [Streptomyces tateyamensis]PYC78708.1 Immediate-early protein 2 [Streptomyces tateyamensis]